jgi:uncharacterized protein YjaG (DUF416 family)
MTVCTPSQTGEGMVEDMVLGKIIAAGVAAAVTVPLMIIAIGIGIWEHRRKEARRSVCQERELRRMLRRVMDEAARREQELKKSLRQDMVADLCIAHTSVQRSLCRRQGRGLWSRIREA